MLKFAKSNIIHNSVTAKFFYLNARSKMRKSTMEHGIVREWKSNPYYPNYQKKVDETEITIMSYNILAQDLIVKHPYLYKSHDRYHLEYAIRSERLFNEMKVVRPDILCLQEMQATHLMDFKVKCFSIDLHEVIFKKRTQADLTDGCAIFYNSDIMELVAEQSVEYFQPNVSVLNRPNVAIIAKFRLKTNPASEIVIATTHLLYNPRRQDVRLAQVQLLLSEIDRIAFRGENEQHQVEYSPVILTGDFNFQPGSAPHTLITNGHLAYGALNRRLQFPQTNEETFGNELLPTRLGVTDDCRHFNRKQSMLNRSEHQRDENENDMKNTTAPFKSGLLTHQLNLRSVYDDRTSASTFQNCWGLVDYIFYRKEQTPAHGLVEKNLKLMARFELPTLQQCFYYLPFGGIPNASQGSDHFSLAAKFLLSPS
ncbi:Protein angel like 2 [Pseudolycoriella hygida]|uniref:Protein angel like 2 n=1 Tax=Pseudolycoriella hygida TaxID=35572 RepID=A0A9Q0S6D5_9DIPT|nr:Protein angel like 2 [Pseudolycoriella hygida]